jgi:hypothetical protein
LENELLRKLLNGGFPLGVLQIVMFVFAMCGVTVFGYRLYDARLRKVCLRRLDSLQQ